ncbi:glucan endo-1,3-beta-glucosidase-like [Impatiens glandulifera]|uniref:glucan endo-1,3-beta-glucosidase-like n=1 Tax=Impatiens glandulifera TaxID=253017 RepID=UPI001FB076F4|nr:glucan endo-1,3-beta-glucosidase-like [Impatiens glandulifera]
MEFSIRKLSLLFLFHHFAIVNSIGVNYGVWGDNLPPPEQVAQFIRTRTTIDRVKIYDTDPNIIRAFAYTGILLTVTIPNNDIPYLADIQAARWWVRTHILPFYPDTKIRFICVGNEILRWGDENMIANLLPTMQSIHAALVLEYLAEIKVTTPHSLNILASSSPPSAATFQPQWEQSIIAPMLHFHQQTRSPFMVNPYPYFSWSPNTTRFTLFLSNPGSFDPLTGKMYYNIYDTLLDAVYSAMKRLGYGGVAIAVGEVGWPSYGGPALWQCSPENARWHNMNVMKGKVIGVGTPLMPGRRFETYLFALFNENKKPGDEDERNFGLFRPDFSSVYDIGIMRGFEKESSEIL